MTRTISSLLLLAVAVFAVSMVAVGVAGPGRVLALLVFFMVVPGAAVLLPLDVPLRPAEWAGLAVAIALSLDAIVVTALLYFGLWSVERGVALLALVVAVAALVGDPFVRDSLRSAVRPRDARRDR